MESTMSKAPATPTPAKPLLDPHTTRTLREMRSVIDDIETGKVALRRFVDALSEEHDGMHRDLSIRVTIIPPKSSI